MKPFRRAAAVTLLSITSAITITGCGHSSSTSISSFDTKTGIQNGKTSQHQVPTHDSTSTIDGTQQTSQGSGKSGNKSATSGSTSGANSGESNNSTSSSSNSHNTSGSNSTPSSDSRSSQSQTSSDAHDAQGTSSSSNSSSSSIASHVNGSSKHSSTNGKLGSTSGTSSSYGTSSGNSNDNAKEASSRSQSSNSSSSGHYATQKVTGTNQHRSTSSAWTISIPSIGINHYVGTIGEYGGEIVPPPHAIEWYTGSAYPGSQGTSVIVGHVSSGDWVPDIFANLQNIPVGSTFTFTAGNGVTHTWRVTGKQSINKETAQRDSAIWGPSSGTHLNLVTCDSNSRIVGQHHVNNLVVFATLVS